MKKILTTISALIIATIIYAQNIDTILDSLGKKQFKKLVNFLDAANPAGFSTNITYDSLPGRIAMFFFLDYWSHPHRSEG